jgi:hypothetical protein
MDDVLTMLLLRLSRLRDSNSQIFVGGLALSGIKSLRAEAHDAPFFAIVSHLFRGRRIAPSCADILLANH